MYICVNSIPIVYYRSRLLASLQAHAHARMLLPERGWVQKRSQCSPGAPVGHS